MTLKKSLAPHAVGRAQVTDRALLQMRRHPHCYALIIGGNVGLRQLNLRKDDAAGMRNGDRCRCCGVEFLSGRNFDVIFGMTTSSLQPRKRAARSRRSPVNPTYATAAVNRGVTH